MSISILKFFNTQNNNKTQHTKTNRPIKMERTTRKTKTNKTKFEWARVLQPE